MTKRYTIRYLSTAEKDLEDIFDYISNDNPSAAMSLVENFDISISKLAENPYLGAVPKDTRLRNLGYRMLVVDMHLVFYIVKKNVIQVRRVIHGARQYGFLL